MAPPDDTHATVDQVYHLVSDIKDSIDKMDARLSTELTQVKREVSGLQRSVIRIEAENAARVVVTDELRKQQERFITREQVNLEFTPRIEATATRRWVAGLLTPTVIGLLASTPAWIALLIR